MSDLVLDRLARANPVPRGAVAELSEKIRQQSLELPPVSPVRSGRRRGVLIAALVAGAALIAGPAVALRFGVIDFSSAPPASPRVVEDFSSLSEGAPAGMDPHVIAGQTRLVGKIDGHLLSVAPTKPGGFCFEWSNASGGCDQLGTVPLGVTWGSDRESITSQSSFQTVDGHVSARWADSVEIKLDDGSTIHPHVIWISPPINAGFFYYRAPEGRAIETVLALKDGRVMTGDTNGSGARPGAHPFADLSKRMQMAQIQTNDGPVTLWTAPTRTEERCTWLEFRGEETPVVPCLPKGYERQAALAYGVHALGAKLILAGECGYRAVEFLHNDGSTRRVDCADGLIFTELQPADATGEIRALDANGRPLAGSTTLVPEPTRQR